MVFPFQEFGYSSIFDGSSVEELAKESQLGNMYVRGYDKTGRPALYFKPGGAGFNAEPAGVKYLVYCVERVPSLHRRCFRALLPRCSVCRSLRAPLCLPCCHAKAIACVEKQARTGRLALPPHDSWQHPEHEWHQAFVSLTEAVGLKSCILALGFSKGYAFGCPFL